MKSINSKQVWFKLKKVPWNPRIPKWWQSRGTFVTIINKIIYEMIAMDDREDDESWTK